MFICQYCMVRKAPDIKSQEPHKNTHTTNAIHLIPHGGHYRYSICISVEFLLRAFLMLISRLVFARNSVKVVGEFFWYMSIVRALMYSFLWVTQEEESLRRSYSIRICWRLDLFRSCYQANITNRFLKLNWLIFFTYVLSLELYIRIRVLTGPTISF